MYRFFIFLFFLFFLKEKTNAQVVAGSFTFKGFIKADSGKMLLMPVGDTSYYPGNYNFQEAVIEKNNFSFTGLISYPYAFRLGLKINSRWAYISDVFFLEPGVQTVICNIDSLWEIPSITNNSTIELRNAFANSIKAVDTKLTAVDKKDDSLHAILKNNIPNKILSAHEKERSRLNNERASIIWGYTKQHPDSYVALWKLVNEFSKGYKPIFDSIYENFSSTIKETYTGLVLAERLKLIRALSIGRQFPNFFLIDPSKNKVTVPKFKKSTKYMLVDFWFSYCQPCISQFETFKNIYANYKAKGFDIAGISVDTQNNGMEWKKAISKYKLPWPQYWDVDQKQSLKFSINEFPSNFLLDRNGKIIAKNIEPPELGKFLSENLKESY